MSASDLLRAKFHSDRQFALYAQHGFDSTLQASRQVASDIYAGLERVSWYSSCLIPQYHNICKELFAEDVLHGTVHLLNIQISGRNYIND